MAMSLDTNGIRIEKEPDCHTRHFQNERCQLFLPQHPRYFSQHMEVKRQRENVHLPML